MEWGASSSAETYELEYSTKKEYLGSSNSTTIIGNIEVTSYYVTGLESGETYFFRVRGVNESGKSGWTNPASIIIGKKPAAPTTWSATTTAMIGDKVMLYWLHNAVDGSKQLKAEIELTINGTTQTIEKTTTQNEDEESENIYQHEIDTKSYSDGVVIKWRVRTSGITNEYGPWSTERRIDVYTPPSLGLSVTDYKGEVLDTITSFPLYIKATPGPSTQTPLSYHVSVIANESYTTMDNIGNTKIVKKGDEIYSQFYDTTKGLVLSISANSIDLENNVTYTIKCVVSMNTGLNAENSRTFKVAWEEEFYNPDAEIGIDYDNLAAYIRPYCAYYPTVAYEVSYNSSTKKYTRTSTKITEVIDGVSVDEAFTDKYDDIVYSGKKSNGTSIYFCVVESEDPVILEDVTLSVYRREYDGAFVKICDNIQNGDNTYVTDPHPALDYARYRIIARHDKTGAISFADIQGYYVGEKSVVIQWDEEWRNFDTTEGSELEDQPWSGSMLKLPYNIDVSDSNESDVTLVKYIGRRHPVSYYGTQIDTTSTWQVEIDKSDKETLYGLRRLAVWAGDVYVREPSGSGYWANISISFNQTHRKLTIPVTMSITRVSGGV